jgi:glutamine amidotransferase
MCLLTFLPDEVLPDTDALLNGAEVNDDGHGFAIVTGDQILVRHGMAAEPMIEEFDASRRAHPHGPALFHSRFSTHGNLRDLANCHPFPLGADPRTVLAHNGVLPKAVQPEKGDPRSDTRIAAETFLPAFGPLRLRRTRRRVERWMTAANKIVILTVDRRFRDHAYILNEQEGIWDDGIWYSNDGYRPYLRAQRLDADERLWASDWALTRCDVCRAVIDITEDECPYCGGCPICGELPDDCTCLTPAAFGHRLSAARRAQDAPNRPVPQRNGPTL